MILTWGLVGCATYEPKPIAPAATATAFDSRRLDSPELRQFIAQTLGREVAAWPPPSWDRELLTLAAYHFHPSLEVARAQWAVARSAEATAGARPNPMLGVAPTYNFNAASGISPWIGGLTADLPIETAGKRGLRLARARQQSEAARWNLHTAAWKVRANVRDALTHFRHQGILADELAQLHAVREQQVKLLEDRLRAGAIALPDLVPTRLLLEKTRLEWDLAGENHAGARARVAEALGVPLRALAALPMQLSPGSPEISEAQLKDFRQQALQGRADLRAALADYEAGQVALQLEIARQYPDLHLGTAFDWDQGENKWKLFSLSAELPVLNRNQGPIAEARARREEGAAKFTALQTKVIADIDAATAVFRTSRARTSDTTKMFAALRSQEETAAARVKAGEGDPLELLSARLERIGVQALSTEVAYRAQLAINQLEDALQQPLDRRAGSISPVPPIEVVSPVVASTPAKP